ncbi:TRAP transporter small permease [Mesorhizobium sp. ASY16-5R]|uniref:TRAP transporter small permease n=1 Tax=Mesorhizobium sp. ASY16-5R TaxID=3445772 RepID=UPI003FA0A016
MSRVQSAAAGFLKQLTRIEQAIAVAGLLLTAAALLVDIFAREVLHSSLFGSLRVAVYATAFAALFGFCVCVASNSHIRVTIFDGFTPASWRPAIYRLADVISFAICSVFAWFAANYVWQTYLVSETDVSLNVVIWPFQLVLIWMFLSAAVRYGLFAACPALRPQEEELAQ